MTNRRQFIFGIVASACLPALMAAAPRAMSAPWVDWENGIIHCEGNSMETVYEMIQDLYRGIEQDG